MENSGGWPGEVPKQHNSRRHLERELFAVALLVFGASFSNIISRQDAVHFALTWSLVNTHSVWLNSTLYSGEPYVTQIGVHAISALPPGLAFFGFAFVAPANLILPLEPSVVAAYLATYFSCIAGALAGVLFFKTAKLFGTVRSSLILTAVFLFGTSMWIYSRIYLPEGLATLLGIASIYCLFWMTRKGGMAARRRVIFYASILSGVLLGLAVFVDNMAVFLVIPMFLYLSFRPNLSRMKDKLSLLLAFVAGLIAGSVPLGYYDLITTGNLFFAPYGVPLIGGVQTSAYVFGNLIDGLYNSMLSPESGILLFTPFLVISFIGLLYLLQEGKTGESLLFIGLFLSILIPFSLQSASTYPHDTIGPSELVLVMPYALLPAARVLDRFRPFGAAGILGYLLASASILINGIIVLTDPVVLGLNFGMNSNTSPLLTTNIPLFLGQSYLTWWSFFKEPFLYASAILAFPLVVLLIYSLYGIQIEIRIKRNMYSPTNNAAEARDALQASA